MTQPSFNFNSIFTESELGNNFKKYLDEKKVTKTLLCLEKICKLETLKIEKEKFDTTIDIYINFIHENAKYQVNSNPKKKKKIF